MEPKINQARRLRTNQTSAEKILWYNLRNRRLEGLKFKRQQCLENFIVDFYCDELKLIIELDGDVHGYKSNSKKDAKRQDFLERKGFHIIRYTNHEIYHQLPSVLEDIIDKGNDLKKIKLLSLSPHPDPLPAGEGKNTTLHR